MKSLDFVIIGAQKCATSALFRALENHPALAMPEMKEAPFFDRDSSSNSWSDFAKQHFHRASPDQLWGKASPQYMAGTGTATRLADSNPGMKLIAMVRDPIERARSHYQMAVRRETETRPFADAITRLLHPGRLAASRVARPPRHDAGYESESDFYLAWSEYGRVLADYCGAFPVEQIMVIEQAEFRRQPHVVLDRILVHLGLEPGYHPTQLGRTVHRGGGQRIVSDAAKQRLLSLPGLKRLWHQVPESYRGHLRFWFDQWNVRSGSELSCELPANLRTRLQHHFLADCSILQSTLGYSPSWSLAYRKQGAAYTT